MTAKSNELICTACGCEALLLRKPVYEGFKRTGESLICSCCGHVYADEESVPFKVKRTSNVFSEADRPRPVQVFDEGENRTLCRYCVQYVINPFMQWCSLHKKEVAATDTCAQFEQKEISEEAEGE